MFSRSIRAIPVIGLLSSFSIPTFCDKPLVNEKSQTLIKDYKDTVILSCSASEELTDQICTHLKTKKGKIEIVQFSDGEVYPTIAESIRGKHVFVVQSCSAPVNVNIMELLLTVTAARRSGSESVTAVIPYFGYRLHRRGLPVSTKYHSKFLWSAAGDFAKMLLSVGVDHVISVDLQRPGQGHEACFFDNELSVETISANDEFISYFKQSNCLEGPVVVVSPNAECIKKAQKFQKKLHSVLGLETSYAAFLHDQQHAGNQRLVSYDPAIHSELLGDVRGCDVIIVDDVVDTGVSLSTLCRRLRKEGAKRVYVCASHGVFSHNSMNLIDLSPVEKVIVTDSIPLPSHVSNKIVQVPVAKLIAKVIEAEVYGSKEKEEDDIFEAE